MTVSYAKRGPDAANYYTAELDRDYYTRGAEPPLTWYVAPDASGSRIRFGIVHGAVFGADHAPGEERLEADIDRYDLLKEGFHPDGGGRLVQNAGDPDRVAIHDFTFSAPKSFSVAWGLGDPAAKAGLQAAQAKSVDCAMDLFSEKGAWTRQGKAGRHKLKTAFLAVEAAHGSSRDDDPQIHTHVPIFNVCQRPDGSTGAIETHDALQWKGAVAQIYHASLAYEARKLGFAITMQDAKGRPSAVPEIVGIPQEVRDAFSQRRADIKAAVEEYQKANGMTVNAELGTRRMFQNETLATRKAKDELSQGALDALWIERGQALGFTTADVKEAMTLGAPLEEWDRESLLAEARLAVTELTERNATFKEPSLYTAIATRLCGRASVADILVAVDTVREELLYTDALSNRQINGAFDIAERTFTTREMLSVERDLLDFARDQAPQRRLDDELVERAMTARDAEMRAAAAADACSLPDVEGREALVPGLAQEQRLAIRHACLSDAAVSVIEGTAGAGKTFVARTIADIHREQGWKVTGLAANWSQAKNLRKEAQLDEHRAIAGWVLDVEKGKILLTEKSLIILDEAGMVGSRLMHKVLKAAASAGAKVVLLGDTRQQSAIDAGDALRIITTEIGSARLDQIRRQRDQGDREAVHQFFAGAAEKALDHYLDRDRVHVEDNADATHNRLVADWMTSRTEHAGASHLILAQKKIDVHSINLRAHEARKAAGELGARSIHLETMDSERRDGELVEFTEGDQVVFRVNDKKVDGVINQDVGVIESIDVDARLLKVRLEDGRLVEFNPADESRQHQDGGLGFQHGYATTFTTSQGMTRDHAFVLDDARMARKQVGVAFSRHRETCQVYVNRAERYEAAMLRAEGKDWKSFERFTPADCVRSMQKTYARQRDKVSTVDFDDWHTHEGFVMNPEVVRLTEKLKLLADAKQRGETMPELPFQRLDSYRLADLPKPAGSPLDEARRRLLDHGVGSHAIDQAERSGFMSYDSGLPVFNGRRPTDGAIVNQVRDGQVSKGVMRDTYPPILEGVTDAPVHVVKTGEDALALWTEADEGRDERPTVIVAAGDVSAALSLAHVRALLTKAKAFFHFPISAVLRNILTKATGQDVVVIEEPESPSVRNAREAQERMDEIEEEREQGQAPTL